MACHSGTCPYSCFHAIPSASQFAWRHSNATGRCSTHVFLPQTGTLRSKSKMLGAGK